MPMMQAIDCPPLLPREGPSPATVLSEQVHLHPRKHEQLLWQAADLLVDSKSRSRSPSIDLLAERRPRHILVSVSNTIKIVFP